MAFTASYDSPAAPSTGGAVGNFEDLHDLITILAPEETPFSSLAAKKTAKATNHEWTIDQLADAESTGVLESSDVATFDDKFVDQLRIGNTVQGFRRSYGTSVVQDAVSSVQANYANASVKAIREIKRDQEKALLSTQDKQTASGSAKSLMRGFSKYVSTSAGSDIPSLYAPAAAQTLTVGGTFTEVLLNAMLGSMYNTSGSLSNVTMIADTNVRTDVSDFMRTGGSSDPRRYNVPGTGREVTLAVDVYNSDFGIVNIVNSNPDCSPDTTNRDTAQVVNFDYVGLATLIPLSASELEDGGAGRRGYCQLWSTLEMLHPQAHGAISLA
jgi:hypothetical protein